MEGRPTHGCETLAHDDAPFIITEDTYALVKSLPRTVGITSFPANIGRWVARIVRVLVNPFRVADRRVYVHLCKFG